jgi:hypothetical protein
MHELEGTRAHENLEAAGGAAGNSPIWNSGTHLAAARQRIVGVES